MHAYPSPRAWTFVSPRRPCARRPLPRPPAPGPSLSSAVCPAVLPQLESAGSRGMWPWIPVLCKGRFRSARAAGGAGSSPSSLPCCSVAHGTRTRDVPHPFPRSDAGGGGVSTLSHGGSYEPNSCVLRPGAGFVSTDVFSSRGRAHKDIIPGSCALSGFVRNCQRRPEWLHPVSLLPSSGHPLFWMLRSIWHFQCLGFGCPGR